MQKFKSLDEIADEYELNIERMKFAREALYDRLQCEPSRMRAMRLRATINSITKAIWSSEDAVRQMRDRHGR